MLIKSLLCVIIFLSIVSVYLRIQNLNLENDLTNVKNENIILKEDLEFTKESLKKINLANEELSKLVNSYKLSSQKLDDKLYKLETNITKMNIKHPKLVSKAINEAQKKVNKCIENITSDNANVSGGYDECE